jgi:hypothetical protein
MFGEGPGCSRAATIPTNPVLQPPEEPAYATGETSAAEIESQRTARRQEQAGVSPTVRMRPAKENPCSSGSVDGLSLESKMSRQFGQAANPLANDLALIQRQIETGHRRDPSYNRDVLP